MEAAATAAAVKSAELVWIVPSPYNVSYCHRPVVQFTDLCASMLDDADAAVRANANGPAAAALALAEAAGSGGGGSKESQLRQFMKLFVQSSFLPRVEADVNIALDRILNDPNAFNAREWKTRGGPAGVGGEEGQVRCCRCAALRPDSSPCLPCNFAPDAAVPSVRARVCARVRACACVSV